MTSVAAVGEGLGLAAVLAEPAETAPERVDRRGPELERAVALAVDGDRHVDHLDVLRRTDGAIRVGGHERKPEDAAIVGSRLAVKADHRRDAVECPCERRGDGVGTSARERGAGGARFGHFAIRLRRRGAGAGGGQLTKRQRRIVPRVLQDVRTGRERRCRREREQRQGNG
jgi:hypothetical protein